MRQITQVEYDALPVVDGCRQCPGNTDYTLIREFGARSSFGERSSFGAGSSFGVWSRFGVWSSFGAGSSFGARSSFGERSSFGKRCEFEGKGRAKPGIPLLAFGGFGSEGRTTYAFDLESGIWVRCGCFFGTLSEFRAKVRSTYGEEGHGRIYLSLANVIEAKFSA